jgi:hypothetical protein
MGCNFCKPAAEEHTPVKKKKQTKVLTSMEGPISAPAEGDEA